MSDIIPTKKETDIFSTRISEDEDNYKYPPGADDEEQDDDDMLSQNTMKDAHALAIL